MKQAPSDTERIAIVGGGYMGGGIAQVFAMHGHPVRLVDQDVGASARAVARLIDEVREHETAELLPSGSADQVAANLQAAGSVEEAVAGADFVTEAVPEIPRIKSETLHRISTAARPNTIIASNTSAIPIADLAQSVAAPERFLGVHWMNPAPFIPGVELIPSDATTIDTIDRAETLIKGVGKLPTRVADSPGFVANRLQFALYKEAAAMVEEELASPEQVDDVVRSTFGFRLALFGPFTIGDMAGLDVYCSSYATLQSAFGEHFAAPKIVTDAVARGNLGLKSGGGLIERTSAESAALVAHRNRAYSKLQQLIADMNS